MSAAEIAKVLRECARLVGEAEREIAHRLDVATGQLHELERLQSESLPAVRGALVQAAADVGVVIAQALAREEDAEEAAAEEDAAAPTETA